MTHLDALFLGILQGLTEFLPVSSSGHIELGKALLGTELENDLLFSVLVHFATVLSTIIVFHKDILNLIKGLLKFQWNAETKFVSFILASMIPVGLVYVLFKEQIESLFTGQIVLVGAMLMVTAVLLFLSKIMEGKDGKLGYKNAIIVGIAQAIAVIPGISRSGSTIATALLLGISREQATKFSFLMVLPPIIGGTLLEFKGVMDTGVSLSHALNGPMLLGALAAFLSGLIACTLMIKLVKRGRLSYFAWYCAAAGLVAIIAGCV